MERGAWTNALTVNKAVSDGMPTEQSPISYWLATLLISWRTCVLVSVPPDSTLQC